MCGSSRCLAQALLLWSRCDLIRECSAGHHTKGNCILLGAAIGLDRGMIRRPTELPPLGHGTELIAGMFWTSNAARTGAAPSRPNIGSMLLLWAASRRRPRRKDVHGEPFGRMKTSAWLSLPSSPNVPTAPSVTPTRPRISIDRRCGIHPWC
jgi:hypothetical protein